METTTELLPLFAPFLEIGREAVFAAFAAFLRIGAAVALLPGFGERGLPMRVKLAAALAFAVIVWPAVSPLAVIGRIDEATLALVFAAEVVAGLLIGLSVRLLIHALQTAGAIAAQSTSLSQIFGGGIADEAATPYGNLLTLAGVALAFALDAPAWAAAALIRSYDVIPFGVFAIAPEVAEWGVGRVADAFALALSLAIPFVLAAFAYNLALGAINRAMPQLMVAFVGAPAITLGALGLMALATPPALEVWGETMSAVLADPLGAKP